MSFTVLLKLITHIHFFFAELLR